MSEAYEHQAHTAPIAASGPDSPRASYEDRERLRLVRLRLRCGIMAIMSGLYDISL